MRAHRAHPDDGATPFDDNYYWSEVVIVDEQAYIMMASPPQFDDKENLVGYLDVFIALLGRGGKPLRSVGQKGAGF
jgi:hypothetical protein